MHTLITNNSVYFYWVRFPIHQKIKYFQFKFLILFQTLTLLLVLAATIFPVCAEERKEYAMLNLTAGQVGVLDDIDRPQRYGIEYRFTSFSGPGGFRLIPAVGFAVSNNGAKFIYSDLRHDFYLGDRWMLIPSFGLGIFDDSEEVELGNELEFRSGIELAYEFRNKMRAGVAIFHLSNAGISSDNPGTESIVFSVCIPILGN